jgi:hypothetical protein
MPKDPYSRAELSDKEMRHRESVRKKNLWKKKRRESVRENDQGLSKEAKNKGQESQVWLSFFEE